MKPPRDRIRGLPFFFTWRFFALFAAASLLLIPVYYLSPYRGLLVPLALDMVLFLTAFIDYRIGPSPRKISLRRPLPYPLEVGAANEISLQVSNHTGREVEILIQDDIPPNCSAEGLPLRTRAAKGGGTRVIYKVKPKERGDGEFGDITFWVKGALGLVWKRGEVAAARSVKLYPGLTMIRRQQFKLRRPAESAMARTRWKLGAGSEFDGLREYVIGDDSRLIHWSTTARIGRLVVRQNRTERSQNVFLVLDAGRMMTSRVLGKTKLDHALDAALLVAHAALEMGDNVGMMVVAQEILCFEPPASTPGRLGRLLDATYSIEPRMEEPRFHKALSTVATRLRRRSLVVIFTDLTDERSSQGLVRYSLGLLPRHLPLVVALADTELVELADSVPGTEQELYRQGVAAELLDRRDHLMAALASNEVMVMDIPPDRISIAALDRYLDIKRRSLL